MKLGVSYNALTGIEILEKSIRSIKDNVDYISVVICDISNSGDIKSALSEAVRLSKIGLVDDYRVIDTDLTYDTENWKKRLEIKQRNVGLVLCENNNCSHFMTMDCDEIYNSNEFANAKKEIEVMNYDSTACQMLSYYKFPNVIIDPPEEYYVPFIYKIKRGNRFALGNFPVLVDPSRIYLEGKFHAFKRSELQMHHFTYVRNSIMDKLLCAPAPISDEFANQITSHYESWNYDKQILTYNGYFNYKVVDPI